MTNRSQALGRAGILGLTVVGLGACVMEAEDTGPATAGQRRAVAVTQQPLTASAGGQAPGLEELGVAETEAESGAPTEEELADLALASDRGRIAPPTYVPFEKPSAVDFRGRARDWIIVKFVEGSHVRLRGGKLAIDLAGVPAAVNASEVSRLARSGFTRASANVALANIHKILAAFPGARLEKSFSLQDADLDSIKAEGEANAGIELADLNLSYNIRVDEADTPALLEALNASDFVEIAYPAPIFYDAAFDLSPTTPSYVSSQGYLNRSPGFTTDTGGVDALFSWTRTGGTGSNVLLLDVEAHWNTAHEDLGANGNNGPTGTIGFSCSTAAASPAGNCPAGAPCHGTAVLGIIRGTKNGSTEFGVTGIAHTSNYAWSSIWQQGACTGTWSVANAIILATWSITQAGDVMLIEQQAAGPVTCPATGNTPCGPAANCTDSTDVPAGQYGLVPVEWNVNEFNAIQSATAAGRVLVEAAGNGEQNLDAGIYNNQFKRTTRDSGAILVGAGVSTTRQPQCFSNFGSRLDVQAWGNGIRSLGYSDITAATFCPMGQTCNAADQNQWYTIGFGGTSGASAIVAGVATAVQGACKAGNIQTVCTGSGQTLPSYGAAPGTYGMRELLAITGVAQPTPVNSQIGPMPNMRSALAVLEPPALGASAAAKWTSSKSAVFSIDALGGMRFRTRTSGGTWSGPTAISGGSFPAGAPIATGFPVSTELRVFSVTTSGQLQYARSSSGGTFTSMSAVSSTNAAPVGANLATGIRNTNQLHVFFVDASSRLVEFHATGTGTSWTGPTIIATNFAPPGAPLATGRQGTNQLDVFAIGSNGTLKAAWALDGGSWNAPVNLSTSGVAPAWNASTLSGGGVATGTQGTNQLDAFFVGNNGILQAAWVVGQGAWNAPVNLHSSAAFTAGAPISTGKHGSSSNTLDVFAKGTNNSMRFLRVVGTGSWSGPTTVTNTSGQSIDSLISTTAGRGSTLFEVYAIGSNGLSVATSTNGGSYGTFSKTP